MKRLTLLGLFLLATQPAAAQPARDEPAPGGLVVSGQVERSRVAADDGPFTLWITFENRTAELVRELRFVGPFRTPGFVQLEACWPSGVPACRQDAGEGEDPIGLPADLSAGAAVTVRGDLKQQGRSGTFLLAGVYGWRDAQGRERRGVVWAGPVEVTKNWTDWRARVTEDLPEVLTGVVLPVAKDLAWPFAFFVLGWMFKAGEQWRAAVQQTWTQMLSKSHENSEHHYMPVSAAIYGWRDRLEPKRPAEPPPTAPPLRPAEGLRARLLRRAQGPREKGGGHVVAAEPTPAAPLAEEQIDESLYYFALLLCRMQVLREKISGFYFKDRLGERIASDSWELLRERFEGRLPGSEGIEKAELLARLVSEHDTFHEFKERLGEEPVCAHPHAARRELWAVRQAFKDWIAQPDFEKLELPVAKLLEEVLDFEMNRPYEPWYNRRESFNRKAFVDLEQLIAAWVDGELASAAPRSRPKERKLACKLLMQLRPYCRRNAGRSARLAWRPLVRLWWMVRLAETWNYRASRRRSRLLKGA